jgi:hypothetical protein
MHGLFARLAIGCNAEVNRLIHCWSDRVSRRLARDLPRATSFDAGQNARRVGVAERHAVWRTKMLIHLPIIILTSLHPMAVADAVPKFDIARECQGEGGTQEMQKRCADDEALARNQLQTEWVQFGAGAKIQCNQETSMDGTPSYVEFLTCLEMERDVRTEREAASKTPK